MPHRLLRNGLLLLLVLALGRPAAAQDLLQQFEPKVTEFTLDNGLTFLVVERHEAPVVSFFTYADVGGADEVKGITGMAHMFEHMAFKGTTTIGSKDLEAELAAMDEVERLYLELKAEQRKGARADANRLAALETAFEEAQENARSLVENGEFEKVIERAGGTGLNATTSSDATRYFYSLPANKTELWFSLEADRFLNPVLREFYTERDVVMEERRMRTESSPVGRLLEEFLAAAFKSHPYGEPVVGHMSDLQSFTRSEAEDFFRTYYGASNLTIAVVGDVDPDEIRDLAETYFGRLPAGRKPDPVETVEPAQLGERRVVIEEQTQPFVLVGYHKGSVNHPDDAVFEVLADILSQGRTSRIYRQLVEQDQLALQAGGFNNFPGSKYPNLFVFYAVPNQGHTPQENEEAIYAIIDDIRENGVTPEELERAKTRARAALIRQLQSNTGIAGQMTFYEVVTGDWRNLFRRLDQIEAVTDADLRRVAQETFRRSNRTVALIQTTAEPTARAEGDAGDDESGR